jgi:hypothetical protein
MRLKSLKTPAMRKVLNQRAKESEEEEDEVE